MCILPHKPSPSILPPPTGYQVNSDIFGVFHGWYAAICRQCGVGDRFRIRHHDGRGLVALCDLWTKTRLSQTYHCCIHSARYLHMRLVSLHLLLLFNSYPPSIFNSFNTTFLLISISYLFTHYRSIIPNTQLSFPPSILLRSHPPHTPIPYHPIQQPANTLSNNLLTPYQITS